MILSNPVYDYVYFFPRHFSINSGGQSSSSSEKSLSDSEKVYLQEFLSGQQGKNLERMFSTFASGLFTQSKQLKAIYGGDPVALYNECLLSIFQTLTRGQSGLKQLIEEDNKTEIMKYLIKALKKAARDKVRHFIWEKRGGRYTMSSLDENLHTPHVATPHSPSVQAGFNELVDAALSSLNDRDIDILLLKAMRYTNQEIAKMVGIHERTVRTVLGRLNKQLGKLAE